MEIDVQPVPYLITPSSPDISAEGVYIADITSFTPILEQRSRQRFLPASTAKIITALVALDVFKPDDIVTVKRVFAEGQTMDLAVGEKITVENLLYGTLVHSANDAAYALADAYGFDRFIEKMNKKTKELNMTNSRFRNPAGLDEFTQYTTPYDLALASRALLENRLLKKIVSTKEIIIGDIEFKRFHTLSNVNKLLGEVQGIGGLKTGFTQNAGENLVSFYLSSGKQFIIVLMKSEDRFEDTKKVVTWINTNVSYLSVQ
ncbi:D-alanyl-D-alanine carboxypeptidase [Candidatus Roizmanbacteria bacterium]|nr:D-alanyl-D-alanine carboxypeptidase [Candidatus Roizmanbacteria bacterium]